MQALPIVLVHLGDSFYIKYCIESIKKFNPNSEIILICEGTKENYSGITKLEIADFNKYGKVLEKIYIHKNQSNPKIELFCIKRWLVLLDFMEKKKLSKVFTMDSDVLLFEDVSKDAKNYSKFDVLLANGTSAGLTFINSKKVLSYYKEIVFDFYKNKVGKVEYEKNGTITDMSFWKKLNIDKKFKVGEITKIIDSKVYDAGLLTPQPQVLMKKGEKVIHFLDKLPFAETEEKKIRFKCLHCQGPTKFYMKYYLRGSISFFDKGKVKLMIFFRDKISPLFPKKLRVLFKRIINKMSF